MWEIRRRKRSARRRSAQLGRVESVFVMVNKNQFTINALNSPNEYFFSI